MADTVANTLRCADSYLCSNWGNDYIYTTRRL